MGIVGRLDQYASMLAGEFDDYSMSENLLTYSEQFNNAVWSKSNTSVSANATIAPDGFSTADNVSNTPSVNSYISQFKSLSTNTTYTFSLYAKPLTANKNISIEWGNPSPSFIVGNFDLNALTFSGSGGGSGTITTLSNGWYRITHTITTGATATPSFNVIYIGAYGSTPNSVTIAFWGAQLEVGSVATDYTPTTTTAKTRVLSSTTNTNITGFSTYFSSGFSENVGAATTLVANVFPPYDPVYDDFGGTLFGASQGRYMRQNTDKSVIVYNEIDEVSDFYSRGVVRAGLVLDLDAGIDSSYAGIGTVWTDLSPYGNNGIFAPAPASPTFNSSNGGYLSFDGGDYVDCGLATFQPTSISLCAWVRHTNSTDGAIIVKGDVNEATEWGISFGYSAPHLLVGRATTFNNQLTYSWTGSLLTGFHYVCYTMVNNTRATLYVDGAQVASTNTIGSIGLNAKNVLIGKWNNYAPLQGDIAQALIYTRELTATEIKQNYDATKGRFGL